jgi:hypothetical protein
MKILTNSLIYQQKPGSMKRIILMACFGMFLLSGLFAQEIDFKYKVDSIKVNGSVKYTVTLNIVKGEGPFSIGIYEDRLKDGLIPLDTKEKIINSIVTLEFSGRKPCLIFVRNKTKSTIKPLDY